MPNIVRVANVNEAVETAESLKRAGEYDWFRGQVKTWPPYSSLFRIYSTNDQGRINSARSRIEQFVRWIMRTPGLETIANNRDALFAVAQHYGIPTHYIDFTTDPGIAGFFACDANQAPEAGTESCIYCLNTKELGEMWPTFVEVLGRPEIDFIKLDVPGLWRLGAQKGTFLFCPMNWDVDYPMDRIVFPYTGYPSYPVGADVYPDQKSPLEIVLDQYFSAERAAEGYRSLREQFTRMVAAGSSVEFTEAIAPPEGYQAECLIGPPSELDSWNPAVIKLWTAVSDQHSREAMVREVRLAVDLSVSASELRRAFTYATRRALSRDDTLRKETIAFRLNSERQLDPRLQTALQWLWNGLRVLPYDNEDIAEAVGCCVFLYQNGLHKATNSAESQRIVSLCIDDAIQIEIGAPDGSDSRGWVSASNLRAAVRSDIEALISPRYRDRCGQAKFLIQAINNPRYLFEFTPLAQVFARQLVPTQVLERTGFAVFFSPARLNVLGLP